MKTLAINGGVHLGCRTNSDGLPYLSSQRFSPPVHLSKPYYDEETGALLVNLSCPTAGLLSGDRMICDIEVSDRASMVATTPVLLALTICDLEWQGLIKSSGLRMILFEFNPGSLFCKNQPSRAKDFVEVGEEAEVLFVEKILPGRIAHGESFLFKKFSNRLRIQKNEQLVLLESFILEPENESINPWKNSFRTPFYGCFYLLSPKLSDELSCRKEIHDLKNDSLLVGSTSMHRKAGWVIKVLAGDPYEFRKAMKLIRVLLYESIGRLPTSFRRY